jgi:hypothetical protein
LFGTATRLANGTRASNGYVALAELDSWIFSGNGDGHLDSADAAFGSLRLWTDRNHDGISQPEELQTLAEAGIRRIDLDYRSSRRTDRYGNEFRFLGRAWKAGRNGVVRQNEVPYEWIFVAALRHPAGVGTGREMIFGGLRRENPRHGESLESNLPARRS